MQRSLLDRLFGQLSPYFPMKFRSEEDDSQTESVSSIEFSDISEDVAEIIVEIDRLQKASGKALASDPADWEEFGRLQAQIQELVNALALEAS